MQQPLEDFSPDSVQVHSDSTVQPTIYTVQELADTLNVSRRTIFSYIKVICEVYHWLPETTFKPSFGKYSDRALSEVRLVQSKGIETYIKEFSETQPTVNYEVINTSIVPTQTKSLTLREQKIMQNQQIANVETIEVLSTLQKLKAEIDNTSNRIKQADNASREARLARLKVKAMKRAIEDYQVIQEVYNSTMQQLETEE